MLEKKKIIRVLAAAGTALLIWKPAVAFSGAADGLQTCIKSVIPVLFPFLFLSQYLLSGDTEGDSGFVKKIGDVLHFPVGTESVILPAFLGGLPIGAKSVYSQYQAGVIDKGTAEKMFALCNNVGPSFIFGVLGLLFENRKTLWLLWGIQIISALTILCCMQPNSSTCFLPRAKTRIRQPPLREAIGAMANICGWVILFRIVISFLHELLFPWIGSELQVLLAGSLEITNGCLMLKNIPNAQIRFVICSGILAFGSLCVVLQTHSVCAELNIGKYICTKLLQALTASILSAFAVTKWKFLIPFWCLFFFGYAKRNEKKSRYSTAVAV